MGQRRQATNRTLDEMDATARNMGIVPGDPAYAFYTGLRRLHAEQQAGLAQLSRPPPGGTSRRIAYRWP